MADAFREITQWKDNTPTGVYLLEGDKCFAFCNYKGEITTFTKPLQIDKRGRKFKKLDDNPFKEIETEVESAGPNVIEVAGSKGNVYHVNTVAKTCDCPGFTYRGKCKHITEAV